MYSVQPTCTTTLHNHVMFPRKKQALDDLQFSYISYFIHGQSYIVGLTIKHKITNAIDYLN